MYVTTKKEEYEVLNVIIKEKILFERNKNM